jgi:uncharacterized protein
MSTPPAAPSPAAPPVPATTEPDLAPRVARALGLPAAGVAAVLRLFAEGNTLPFIARYRKEATGGLDELQIGHIELAHAAAAALEERRATILDAVRKQGALSPALEAELRAAADRQTLEDLYTPFKKKRKTRASVARDRGLSPLADLILKQGPGQPEREAARFVGAEVPDAAAALAGASDIVAERVAERADVRAAARAITLRQGRIKATVTPAQKAKTGERTRFEDYYAFEEPIGRVASHRYLAIRRGEAEGALRVGLTVEEAAILPAVARLVGLREGSPWAPVLRAAIEDGYHRLLAPSLENELRGDIGDWAEAEAADVFATNTRSLLLSAPYGRHAVVGIDPGFRTGCKCAAVSPTGRYLGHLTLYPHTHKNSGAAELVAFVRQHGAEAIAVGNGTAGRETLDWARAALSSAPSSEPSSVASSGITGSGADLSRLPVALVSEVGASVYSASEVAREEFPDLDLTIRGAISIARRLQDPLAELVKVEPRSLGVGQYQHDIQEGLLSQKLDRVVESCVNHVGVSLDTASAALLRHVAGVGPTLARRIVEHRDREGPFRRRADLRGVSGMGPKTFEQAAGFLRIPGALDPLDDSAVHPERYALVEQMARDLGVEVRALVGDRALIARIDLRRYAAPGLGEPTLRDILTELARPGRDPRPPFAPPRFRDDVRSLEDLQVGMELEGVITNVTAFGAFVDVGVHQDGLLHTSLLPKGLSVGHRLTVSILSVDLQRRRISLGPVRG